MAYKIIKSNDGVEEDREKCEILIESQSDLANVPETAAPGSVAYTADMSAIYMKAINGNWTQIGG